MASYFRQFISNFSTLAAPLYQLTSSSVRQITWLPKHEEARNKLIQCLTNEPVLAIFNPALPIELHTDASSEGYGAVLIQKKDNKAHPVAYFSKRTTDPESRYHSYELETMAVVNAVRHFRHYLFGKHLTVVTDCNSLKASRTKRDLTPRAHRWWTFLQSFDFEIIYREGKRLQHADYFSRNPLAPEKQMEANKTNTQCNKIYHTQALNLHRDWLAAAQQRDDELTKLTTALKSDQLNPDLAKTYDVRNNVLYRKIQRNRSCHYLPIVPHSMIWSVINHVHTNLKHLG